MALFFFQQNLRLTQAPPLWHPFPPGGEIPCLPVQPCDQGCLYSFMDKSLNPHHLRRRERNPFPLISQVALRPRFPAARGDGFSLL